MKRFWIKVKKTKTCWLWTASKGKQGYGNFYYNGSTQLAHRVSYLLAYKQPTFQVLHTCDNTSCVRPSHLYEGTQKKNMQDMYNRKRGRKNPFKGEQHPNSKLSNNQAEEIKIRFDLGFEQKDIAKIYNVSPETISGIINNRRYAKQ